ncbi:hypothetical protein [Legionella shakespearei]|uniref:hypothetical protein n=1 Tax=Legionella shakespearei TaxID=45075 RepID=UPI0012DDDD7E|nr:hypothetical protein [Legionella shakespearei]
MYSSILGIFEIEVEWRWFGSQYLWVLSIPKVTPVSAYTLRIGRFYSGDKHILASEGERVLITTPLDLFSSSQSIPFILIELSIILK